MPKVSDEHKAAVREGLIEAAIRVLSTKGFEATTTRAVMQEAGVSAGTYYHYFDSKEALLTAVGEAVAERELSSGLRPSTTERAADALAAVAVRMLAARPGHSLLPSLRTQAEFAPAIRAFLARYDRQLVDAFGGALDSAKRDGDIAPDVDSPALAELAALVFEGLQARARADTFATSYNRVSRAFMQLLALGATTEGSALRDLVD